MQPAVEFQRAWACDVRAPNHRINQFPVDIDDRPNRVGSISTTRQLPRAIRYCQYAGYIQIPCCRSIEGADLVSTRYAQIATTSAAARTGRWLIGIEESRAAHRD